MFIGLPHKFIQAWITSNQNNIGIMNPGFWGRACLSPGLGLGFGAIPPLELTLNLNQCSVDPLGVQGSG